MNDSDAAWLKAIHARGWDDALSTALDALEPLGPLGAQALYVMQPFVRVLGGSLWQEAAAGIAAALETPEGIAALRAYLDEHNGGT